MVVTVLIQTIQQSSFLFLCVCMRSFLVLLSAFFNRLSVFFFVFLNLLRLKSISSDRKQGFSRLVYFRKSLLANGAY